MSCPLRLKFDSATVLFQFAWMGPADLGQELSIDLVEPDLLGK